VLVEQSVSTAIHAADRALFLDRGAIRFRGPTAELVERPDLLRSVFLDGAVAAAVSDALPPAADAGPLPRVDVAPDAQEAPVPARPVLACRNVTLRFGAVTALDDVTLELHDGEILALIGPNGAGKTTLFDVVSGFVAPDDGGIEITGVDVSSWRAARRARLGLARSFQDARLFPGLTVHQTICVALDRALAVRDPLTAALRLPSVARAERRLGRRADELVEQLAIGAFRDKFIAELSTGSRRIVELACQMGAEPTVVLLDEPSAGIAQRETEALGALRSKRSNNNLSKVLFNIKAGTDATCFSQGIQSLFDLISR
jgi:branched-chain amino acid transport system ATP-binding protein